MTLNQALKYKMPFGKYKGIHLGQIARLDSNYLIWARKNIEHKDTVDAINFVVQEWTQKTKGKP